ncbi:MAG: restriction endonuclease subunit S, partial [Bacilli bacterium]
MAKQNIMKAIDDLRATVVGKIPMPNSQVEQITLALLYKFMDDMDQSSIDFGGNATFFSKEFEKYSWKKIMSNCNSAQVRYNLYTEALEKFYA